MLAAIRRRRWGGGWVLYLRLMVVDRPGVIADIDRRDARRKRLDGGDDPAGALAGRAVPVVLTTHETNEAAIARVAIAWAHRYHLEPAMMPIECCSDFRTENHGGAGIAR